MNNQFFGKHFVLLGLLPRFHRSTAATLIELFGGVVQNEPTEDTNYALIGKGVSPEAPKSKRLQQLRNNGVDIITLDEELFESMIDSANESL